MASNRAAAVKKAQGVAIQYAFFRWESALVLAGTLVVTFFFWNNASSPLPSWGWPVIGALALAALVYSSLTDPDTNARLLWEVLQGPVDPKKIQESSLRDSLREALTLQQRFELEVQRQKNAAVRSWLNERAEEVDSWTQAFAALIWDLDRDRQDPRMKDAQQRAAEAIETVVSRRRFERNPQAQQRLNESMEKLGKQWEALRQLGGHLARDEALLISNLTVLKELSDRIVAVEAADVEGGAADALRMKLVAQIQDVESRLANLTTLVGMIDFGGDA